MYYIGFDIGSSSIKVALIAADSGKHITTLNEPRNEMEITALKSDWAEQDPDLWWKYVCAATKRIIEEGQVKSSEISGIGISYQMHGLVVVDDSGSPLRNAIIWCDSRAVEIGNRSFTELGEEKCMSRLLNSPGNFTLSKLKWVQENEPEVYGKIHKFMLPGDYIAFKLTGKINTTKNGLSEGIGWDFKNDGTAGWLFDYFGIDKSLIPSMVENFTIQGRVNLKGSEETGIAMGTPIIYRAGDQPNNALSLNILNHGEVAATGGTSGVLYAVTNNLKSKESLRINQFAHVNYTKETPTLGKLLCINGAGIMYRWLRKNTNADSYETMNEKASKIPVGSDGVLVLPFGNGAERMLNNKNIGAHFLNLNLNQHGSGHLYRAALEGIAFSFVYGMEILKNDNAKIEIVRAGNDNLFRSALFGNTIATLIGHEIEIYNTTGAVGAARACSLTDGNFNKLGDYVSKNDYVKTFKPLKNKLPYLNAYQHWKKELQLKLDNH